MVRRFALVLLLAGCWACSPDTPAGRPQGDGPHAGDGDYDAGDPALSGDSNPGDENGYPPYPEPEVDGLIRGVDPVFWANTDDFVFEIVEQSNVRLYWALLDANFYRREEHRALGIELIRHPQSFFANAVVPLLERYASTGVFYAVDCMNEPEAMIGAPDGNYQTWGVSWEEMRAYLAACADTVHLHAPGVPVSAGSGWHDWDNVAAGRFDGLGFDFLDYHYYDDSPAPPSVASLGVSVPVIIGECGQQTDTWDDTLQKSAVTACFSGAKAGGYDAAFAWYYNEAGSTNHHTVINADGSWRPVVDAFTTYANDAAIDIGLNLAWLSGGYDHDFGPNPLHPQWGVAYEHDAARAVIDDYELHGIGLMRLWAFEAQEALPFHVSYDDFGSDVGDWQASDAAVAVTRNANGQLRVAIDTASTGWYGITKQAPFADALINLAPASEWSFWAQSSLGVAVGVNLAFVTDSGGLLTYQTMAPGGQLWLEPGASTQHTVSLNAADFPWALDSAPSQAVARPGDTELARVTELRIRVYLGAAQLPVNGALLFDEIGIR